MWHNLEVKTIFEKLDTSLVGLTSDEAKLRLKRNGINTLPKSKKTNILKIFIRQFLSPIIFILIIAIILSVIVKEYKDAIFIFIVVMFNGILGAYQEFRAEKSAEKLEEIIRVNIQVLRDCKEIEMDSSNIVIGDIIILEAGNKVPADIRLIEVNNFSTNESILTGESLPRYKDVLINKSDTLLADRTNIAYAGTVVTSGKCKGVVVATSIQTEFGKIASKVLNVKESASPLTIRINKFIKQISLLFVAFALILAIILYYKGYIIKEIFFSIIALTVSAIPEGLSAAITIILSLSSNRMAKRNVIVKKLNSVESLGSCTVIASDKTGTLTMNEQTAKMIVLPNDTSFYIKGTGYNDLGEVIFDGGNEQYINDVKELIELGVINNDANLNIINGEWQYFGDSIDIAFLALGYKLNITKENLISSKILGSIPFDSKNKFSAVFFESYNNIFCTVKGSVEKIIEFCDIESPIKYNKIFKQNEGLAKNGYRVLAIAKGIKNDFNEKNSFNEVDIPPLKFIGLIGFVDPVREDTIASVEKCKNAGVKVVMITGDHPLTAFSIAKRLNILKSYDEVTSAQEIEIEFNKGKDSFDNFTKNIKVYARVSPMQKLEIVESLKRQGEFVAVTGDGVNDAPALKVANIGVAMGSGSDIAKETGNMIITNDNFSSIVSGIEEGRKAYNNIRNVIYLLLSTGLSEIILYIFSILFNLGIPLNAIQFLWLNLITNGIQGDALSFEKGAENVMKQKIRKPNENIFNKVLIKEILISASVIGITAFILNLYLLKVKNFDIKLARTYILLFLIFAENIHILNCRSEVISFLKVPIKNNYFVIVSIIVAISIQIIIIQIPILRNVFEINYINGNSILGLLILTLPVLCVMELFKKRSC